MDLNPILAAIGRNLVSLNVRIERGSIQGIINMCPNLEHLSLQLGEPLINDGRRTRWENGIKQGFQRLKILSIDYKRVSLGSGEWMGNDAW
jgi:hypothetical protein